MRLDPRFESQKLRLVSVRYLFEKNQQLDTEARADLIRTVLSEGNFRRAQQAFPKTNEKKRSGPSAWAGHTFFSTSGGYEGYLEKEMKALAAKVPDAHFLNEGLGRQGPRRTLFAHDEKRGRRRIEARDRGG